MQLILKRIVIDTICLIYLDVKKTIITLLLISYSCSKNESSQEQNNIDCSGDYSTAGVLVDINEEIYDDESVNDHGKYSWSSDESDEF